MFDFKQLLVDSGIIVQCIPEHEDRNDKLQCQDRGNHQLFQTTFENLPFIDPEQMLTPCNNSHGIQGFNCSGHCVPLVDWCNPSKILTCEELFNKTATAKTVDPVLCSNQSFWEDKPCKGWRRYRRCTGDRPGQCNTYQRESGGYAYGSKCVDGSHET